MFLDQEPKKEQNLVNEVPAYNPAKAKNKKILFFSIIILAVILASVFLIVYSQRTAAKKKLDVAVNKPIATSTNQPGGLPGEFNNDNGGNNLFGTSTDNLKAEDISFGFFYKKKSDDFQPAIKDFNLPVNIKVDAINYYDISRKIDLDKYIADLDKNGYTIFKNNISPTSQDFYSMYRYLLSKNVPVIITSDFILYYYQNTFKKVYKEVEKNVFYENVWDINKKLFTIALTRYKTRLTENGMVNEPVLEAERLELAYFAVALKLLSPTADQINIKNNLDDAAKFNTPEAEKYDFTVPDYLKDDVEKEVSLIKSAKGIFKSPVFLYNIDYSTYSIPENYKNNVKLNNFYLVLKWFNSSFPLYYKSENCPNCLLDYEDWLINMAAANFIAKDLADNQDLKNRWAIIYKFISFFSGLRQDLTYLHYNLAMEQVFGKNYSIEDVFSSQNENRKNDLVKIQNKLAEYNFSKLEGMLDRSKSENKYLIGMRMLQQSYWPNDFIFKQLSGTNLKSIDQTADFRNILTACKSGDKENYVYRCAGFGMDIVNLLYPVNKSEKYFTANTNYENYNKQLASLREETEKFDNYSWNNNIYWLDLDLSRTMLKEKGQESPVFMRNQKWLEEKDYNTVLGGWVNLHLAEDELINYEQKSSGLGMSIECSSYNYIEPNLNLIQEMIARNEMLVNMLTMLHVAEKTNAVSIELKELDQKLGRILSITKKELTDTDLDQDDCAFIKDLATHYEISNKTAKSFTLNFEDKKITENISGLKLLAIINQFSDKKAIAIGPIFNYLEY